MSRTHRQTVSLRHPGSSLASLRSNFVSNYIAGPFSNSVRYMSTVRGRPLEISLDGLFASAGRPARPLDCQGEHGTCSGSRWPPAAPFVGGADGKLPSHTRIRPKSCKFRSPLQRTHLWPASWSAGFCSQPHRLPLPPQSLGADCGKHPPIRSSSHFKLTDCSIVCRQSRGIVGHKVNSLFAEHEAGLNNMTRGLGIKRPKLWGIARSRPLTRERGSTRLSISLLLVAFCSAQSFLRRSDSTVNIVWSTLKYPRNRLVWLLRQRRPAARLAA
jgi:hypothetical protein